MQTTRLIAMAVLLGLASAQTARADCAERIDDLREMQADTRYLDASRPDLERLRRVAQKMAAQGKEQLCQDLVRELEAIVREHGEHAENLEQLGQYAIPVPVGSYSGRLYSSRLVGTPVRNRLGRELGVVETLIIDPSGGQVQAVIIEHGGFMGIGEKDVSVPWNELHFTPDGSAVVLDLTEKELEALPKAERDDQ